ncbi:MAG: PspC domain-containing protein [Bacteroidales bacterium]|jgi:phage shock protein PspC (stress-responsive transcriptional regulator)
MKKVEKVSIGRYAFILEEDAYIIVKNYLQELEHYYGDKEGGTEIMEGIEERMAELLLEKCGLEGVASISMVDQIIAVLGRPEVIEGEESDTDTKKYKYNPKRKLYRDPVHKVLGGVCSGMAAYFNLDIALVRVIAIILLIGFFSIGAAFPWSGGWMIPIIYIIMWIIIPEAKTVRQKCEMRGESGRLNDIQKRVVEEANDLGERAKEFGKNNSELWRVIGRIFCVLFGIILLIIGFSGLLGGAFVLFGINMWDVNITTFCIDWLSCYAPSFYASVPSIWIKIPAMLIYFLPFIGILYSGIQLTFGFKSPKWKPGLIIFILWLISLIIFCILCSMTIFSI